MAELIGAGGLSRFFRQHGVPEIVIFAGKGGLGKTTSSASLAYHMAVNEGKQTLCFSTDPQASLSDIFERDFYGKDYWLGIIRRGRWRDCILDLPAAPRIRLA